MQDPDEAIWLELDGFGRYVDASPAALALLGISLAKLRERMVGDLGLDANAIPWRTLWAEIVGGQIHPVGGHLDVVGADGTPVRLIQAAFDRIGEHRWRATLRRPDDGEASRPHLAGALVAWRDAARRVAALAPDDPRRADTVRDEQDAARIYRELYSEAQQRADRVRARGPKPAGDRTTGG